MKTVRYAGIFGTCRTRPWAPDIPIHRLAQGLDTICRVTWVATNKTGLKPRAM